MATHVTGLAAESVVAMTGAPGFWLHETSGVLRPAVEAYLNGIDLSGDQIAALRAYLRQWVMAEAWDQNPHATDTDRELLAELRQAIDRLLTSEAIDLWLYEAFAIGIDPL